MHQLTVRALSGAIISENDRSVALAGLVLVVFLRINHQLLEHRKINILEPFALEEAPVLIAAFEEVSSIKLHRFFQFLSAGSIELLSGYLPRNCRCLLEHRHVQPNPAQDVDLCPIVLSQKNLWAR